MVLNHKLFPLGAVYPRLYQINHEEYTILAPDILKKLNLKRLTTHFFRKSLSKRKCMTDRIIMLISY